MLYYIFRASSHLSRDFRLRRLSFRRVLTRRSPTLLNNFVQTVADAYYVLSDPARRREYDALLSSQRSNYAGSTSADDSANFFSNFANMFQGAAFGSAGPSGSGAAPAEEKPEEPFERPDAETTFGNVFEEVSYLFKIRA